MNPHSLDQQRNVPFATNAQVSTSGGGADSVGDPYASPKLLWSTPADEASSGVSLTPTIVLHFSHRIDANEDGGIIYITDGATQTVIDRVTGEPVTRIVGATDTRELSVLDGAHVDFSGTEVTITLPEALNSGLSYSIIIAPGVIMGSNNLGYAGISDATVLNFTPSDLIDTEAPTLVAGPGGDVLFDIDTPLTLSFNEAVYWEGGDDFFELTSEAAPVRIYRDDVVFSTDHKTITVLGASQVFAGHHYELSLPQLADAAGNLYAGSAIEFTASGVYVDHASPTAEYAQTQSEEGHYGIGETIEITVEFDEAVVVVDGETPHILMNTGDADDFAVYASGSGTNALTFYYTVEAGDIASELNFDASHNWAGLVGALKDTDGNFLDAAHISFSDLAALVPDGYGTHSELVIDGVAPTAEVSSIVLSHDSGASATDGITDTAVQNLSGTYTGTLDSGDKLMFSIDNEQFVEATTAANGSWTLAGFTLDADHSAIRGVVQDLAGNRSEPFIVDYTFDDSAPTGPSTPVLLTDLGVDGTDNLTTATGTLSFGGTAEAGAVIKLYNASTSDILATETADENGAWTIDLDGLAEGALNVAATQTDLAGNTSTMSGTLTIDIDNTAPDAPSAPNLDAASDTGIDDTYYTDNITHDTTPTFSGTGGVVNETVVLYADGVWAGSAIVGSGGEWQVNSSALSDGIHSMTVKMMDNAGNFSAASDALSLEIDTVAPTLVGSTPEDGGISDGSMTLDFSENIVFDESGSFDQTAVAGGAVVSYDWASVEGSHVYLNLDVENGDYTLSMNAETVADLAGNYAVALTGVAALSFTVEFV